MEQSRAQFTLSQWLNWVEQMHPSEIDLGLDRIRQVYQRLAVDFGSTQLVTVAGTNGKGSTISYLSEILQAAGYRTGCYTSPHFLRYNERVRIGREEATDEQLCEAFRAIDAVREDVSLTYFEWGTLVALWLLARAELDVALLEVGLGGRLDAINIVDPHIAVVTSIGLDHVDWLGDDIEGIAAEKAGIFRTGRPAVCGADPAPAAIAATAERLGARLYQKGAQFSVQSADDGWQWQGLNPAGETVVYRQLPYPQLPFQNAATALQVLSLLPLAVDEAAIHQGLRSASMTGRMQQVALPEGRCILDVAHNPQAAELLAERLADHAGRVRIVLGMLGDKDAASVMQALQPLAAGWYLATLEGARGCRAERLAEQLAGPAGCFDGVLEALSAARAELQPDECLLVAGSFYTVSAALDALKMEK
ncbi:bifunctional tetrahydrofolate synthase/dihydrofolate synthase [Marinobacterium arenosum]|uniref:bifunctional tetrahydrofolate synthase/dihydrofolate synthase n=1 Tax=Marinobacterium arenosum TaxID=2862496 RepID=UPI001C970964|nr:bifunctional tetrahydrofolate synthase/dihydrofolate synthase [Marinobacterium arenosum]MBY4675141.1 bifunctional tetrahydrofolate synthase/dihydrofolate synthase [Marinobacterium arenosum]